MLGHVSICTVKTRDHLNHFYLLSSIKLRWCDSFVRKPNGTVLHLKPFNFVFCLCPDDANYVIKMVIEDFNTKKYLIEYHFISYHQKSILAV